MDYPVPEIKPGERCLAVGRTGSGKSLWCRWIMSRSKTKWVIIDLKHDPCWNNFGLIIDKLPDVKKLLRLFTNEQFIIIRPKINLIETVDDWILYLHDGIENIGLCIDELYFLSSNGRAGNGLLGWLTRGRVRKQSFLGGTQRPAWITKFCFSESTYFAIFNLNLLEDRKRVYEFVGNPVVLQNPDEFFWRWYIVKKDKLLLYAPIPFR